MSGISTFAQTQSQVRIIKNQQAVIVDLSRQLSSGYKAEKFSGLGTDAQVSQRARASFTSIEQYTKNTDSADLRLSLMIDALSEFKAQAENLSSELLDFGGKANHQKGDIVYDTSVDPKVPIGTTSADPDLAFQRLKSTAASVFTSLERIVNEKDGQRYLFSGDQALTKPYTDNGTVDAALSSLMDDWRAGSVTTEELNLSITSRDTSISLRAITDATLGYATPFSSGTVGGVSFRPDSAREIDYTTLANDSSIRDVMVAAAYIRSESLGPIVDEVDPDTLAVTTQGAPGDNIHEMQDSFYEMLQTVSSMLENALDGVQSSISDLEITRAQIADISSQHKDDQAVLTKLIGDVENADINEVAVRLNSVNTSLNVSYSVTAIIQQTSLVNFI